MENYTKKIISTSVAIPETLEVFRKEVFKESIADFSHRINLKEDKYKGILSGTVLLSNSIVHKISTTLNIPIFILLFKLRTSQELVDISEKKDWDAIREAIDTANLLMYEYLPKKFNELFRK